ncbi:TatD family hydrolase [Candidatus Azambacteria bacterium]|nr:TatD family hydrolase [Candidatus Azambacteria bacterium]
MFVDSHTHVQFAAYRADREEVIKRALEKGIWMVNVGTQYSTSKSAIELAEKYPEGLYATVGFHPLNIEKTYNDPQEAPEVGQEAFDIERLRELASHPKVVAIGECGLDYARVTGDRQQETKEKQKEIFLQQIELAKKVQNFGGVITFTEDYTSVVAQVPLEQILLETDAPYVAPVPYRGKRNEPAYVEEVAKKIARVKGISFEEVARVTTENVKKLFELTKLTSG